MNWLADAVAPLNAVAFTLWGDPVSWAELLGFITGGACVALTVRRSIANFPVGIANSSFFLVTCSQFPGRLVLGVHAAVLVVV